MSKAKQQRRAGAGPQFDPTAQKISYGMSPVPGAPAGPGNMNGHPGNVLSLGSQRSTMDLKGETNLYGDAMGIQYPQTGADILNPINIPRSKLQQNNPIGQRNNAAAPYNLQQGPPAEMADQMAGGAYAMEAQRRGLQNVSQFMGPVGLPPEAVAQGAVQDPGTMPAAMPGTSGQFLPPMTSMNPMTPGATPQKTGKKKGKN